MRSTYLAVRAGNIATADWGRRKASIYQKLFIAAFELSKTPAQGVRPTDFVVFCGNQG
jgi:hypothetical protein